MDSPSLPQASATTVSSGYLLSREADLADIAARAVDMAQRLGVSGALASVRENSGLTLTATGGDMETATRDGAQGLSVTLFKDGRTGRASTQAMDDASLRITVEKALAIATQVEPDDEAGLAEHDALAWTTPDVPLFAPSDAEAGQLMDQALASEAGALSGSPASPVRVLQAGASSYDTRWALATSHGFCRAASASMQQRWCMVIAERDGVMKRSFWSSMGRRSSELMAPAEIGMRAAERASAALGARDLPTQTAAVLIDAHVAGSLMADFCHAVSGMPQYHRMTCLPDALGKLAFADHVDLTEDPFAAYGLASAAFDSEGVAARPRHVVEAGVVSGLFLSSTSARKLKMLPTGHADGPTNLNLTSRKTECGDDTTAMLRKLDRGLWLTEFLGGNVNPVTGAYSKAASGFWIEGGQIVAPVHNFTVSGNLLDILRGIVAIGTDVYPQGPFSTGSLLVESLQIAGR